MAQEAFARLLDTRRPIGDPGASLRATTLNLSRSRLRRVRVARRPPALPEATVAGPEDTTGSLAAHRPLRHALGELPSRQREAIVLRFYAEMTEAEVARAMGMPAWRSEDAYRYIVPVVVTADQPETVNSAGGSSRTGRRS